MKYILFGAGWYGKIVLTFLGEEYVECFADNKKCGTIFSGKPVISFEEMVALADKFRIIVTTSEYENMLVGQLRSAGIEHFLTYPNRNMAKLQTVLPSYNRPLNTQYMSYADVLSYYNISQYNRIVIWGNNQYIDDLLFEIALQSGIDNIMGIIDAEYTTQDYMGIPFISSEQIEECDCLIINKKRTETSIRDILAIKEVHFDIVDLYDVDKFITYTHHPELAKYQNIHKGKRAFIVGNGPSLTVEDLEILHQNNEICFAANYIYRIYEQTSWRPDYLCMTDLLVIRENEKFFKQLVNDSVLFVADCYAKQDHSIANLQHLHLIIDEFAPNMPGFSKDITQGVYLGYSVLYNFALQIAAYMGFSELYLIGVDHNLTSGASFSTQDHFFSNYFSQSELDTRNSFGISYQNDKVTLGFQKAELYSRTNGFRIYNATRGGKLEVFERVNFDSLFSQ